jgi:hypothetical protein
LHQILNEFWAPSFFRFITGHALGIWFCRCSLFYRREI